MKKPAPIIQEMEAMTKRPIILSVYDYTGTWSRPYAEAGYRVVQIDLKLGIDVFQWDYKKIPRDLVLGILAAPDCTHFTRSGAKFWEMKDSAGITRQALKHIQIVVDIASYFEDAFWALENPVGRINRLMPFMEAYGPWYFDPCDFGDPWRKKTGLWGRFNKPEKTPVEPKRYCRTGSWVHLLGGKSERTKEIRSVTPPGFAKAFFNANNPAGLV